MTTQHGVATAADHSDARWFGSEIGAKIELAVRVLVFPSAHLVVRDVGPARAAGESSFDAHVDDALGLGL